MSGSSRDARGASTPGTSSARTRRRHTSWIVAVAVTAVTCAGGAVWALDGPDRSTGDRLLKAEQVHQATGNPGAGRPSKTPPPIKGRGAAHVAQPAPSQVDSETPRQVTFPSGTIVPIRTVATAPDGELQIPADINTAGWWDGGSKLGDPFGTVVVAAHIDSFTQGLGRFDELLSLHPGEVVRLASAGLTQQYRVSSARLVPKTSLTADSSIYSARGESRLVLLTCGGAYDPELGGYQSNMVVVATPIGTLDRS